MVSQSTRFVPQPLKKQRFSAHRVITIPCHQPNMSLTDICHKIHACAVTPLRAKIQYSLAQYTSLTPIVNQSPTQHAVVPLPPLTASFGVH